VPQRYEGNGLTIRAPSFSLPKDVTTVEQAKQFVADKFDTTPDNVRTLGESYFCHIGITPHRIFPFAVSSSKCPETTSGGSTSYADLRHMNKVIDIVASWNVDTHIMWCLKTVQRSMTGQSDMEFDYVKGRDGMKADQTSNIMQSTDFTGTEDFSTAHAGSEPVPSSGSSENYITTGQRGLRTKKTRDLEEEQETGDEPMEDLRPEPK